MKRIVTILLIGVLCFSMASCSNTKDEAMPPEVDSDIEEVIASEVENEDTPEPTPEAVKEPPKGGAGVTTEEKMALFWYASPIGFEDEAKEISYEDVVEFLGDEGKPYELLNPEENKFGFLWTDETDGKYSTLVLAFEPDEEGNYCFNGHATMSGFEKEQYKPEE